MNPGPEAATVVQQVVYSGVWKTHRTALENLAELGLELPEAPKGAGNYEAWVNGVL